MPGPALQSGDSRATAFTIAFGAAKWCTTDSTWKCNKTKYSASWEGPGPASRCCCDRYSRLLRPQAAAAWNCYGRDVESLAASDRDSLRAKFMA